LSIGDVDRIRLRSIADGARLNQLASGGNAADLVASRGIGQGASARSNYRDLNAREGSAIGGTHPADDPAAGLGIRDARGAEQGEQCGENPASHQSSSEEREIRTALRHSRGMSGTESDSVTNSGEQLGTSGATSDGQAGERRRGLASGSDR